MATSKRILSITIKRINDDSPDTSWLGEYSGSKSSEFSIDRKHTAECATVTGEVASEAIQRVMDYLFEERRKVKGNYDEDSAEGIRFYAVDSALDLLSEKQDEASECDCDESGDLSRGEYRYFNPSFNYVDSKGNLVDGNTAEEVRKYVAQDYARMESLNAGNWSFIGIQAVAKIEIDGVRQTLTSAGLFGFESDSDDSEFKSTAEEEVHQLRSILTGAGFSKRAIATAVKDVDYEK